MLSTWVLSGVVFGVEDSWLEEEEDNPLVLLNALVVDERGDVDALLLGDDDDELLLEVVLVNPFVVDRDGNRFDLN